MELGKHQIYVSNPRSGYHIDLRTSKGRRYLVAWDDGPVWTDEDPLESGMSSNDRLFSGWVVNALREKYGGKLDVYRPHRRTWARKPAFVS